MESIRLVARNGEAVRQALERGEVLHLDTASEEITDEFLLFAIKSGLLQQWAEGFPDPRNWSEIGCEVILAAEVAARFAGIYSQRKTGYVLRSARVLGALGYSLEVLEEGAGLSGRGTPEDQLYSGDVLRKLLGKAEKQVKVTEEDQAAALPGGAEVKVRSRASRRAIKEPKLDQADAAARSHAVARGLLDWYNQTVGPGLLTYAQTGNGRRIHILDATKIEVELERGTYECSGVVKDEDDGQLKRGYKLGTIRTLLETAGILTQATVGQIQTHDCKLCEPMLKSCTVFRAGDLLLEDRGFLDGEMITWLKCEREVDVIVPLRHGMLSYEEAVKLAQMADQWDPHPTRDGQQIAFVRGVEHVWDECQVPLNACVIRFYNEKKKAIDYIVLVTTDLSLNAKWIVKHYEQRPEIEQDYEQLKSGGWLLTKLSSTRYSQIVFYLLTVALSYSLYQLFANTAAGSRFAGKTRQAIAFEQLKTRRTNVIVYAGGYFEIFETLSFVYLVLNLSPGVQTRLRHWMEEYLPQLTKRE
ncbi:MAG: transposase [Acidobacteriales bacterium]|nr:transposase [Terriglobales bacterium]